MPALKRPWTMADLDDFPDDGQRHEAIDGELLFVTPSASLPHQAAVGELIESSPITSSVNVSAMSTSRRVRSCPARGPRNE